jgi:dephospho-CoA kinase
MAGPHPILKVGLTGGIASGKSTVAGFLRELGAFIVDADQVARQVMARGAEAHNEVVEHFGRGVLDDDGEIDRSKLAEIVFNDTEARSALNDMVHPRIREEAARRFERCAHEGASRLAVYDAALLVETGVYRDMDKLIVVSCRTGIQVERLILRGGMGAEQAEARIAAQASMEEKLAAADYVIETDGSLDETRRQTEWVYAGLLDDHARLFGA